MKKRVFSAAIYFDIIKQLKIIGTLFLVILLFFGIAAPLSTVISQSGGYFEKTVVDFDSLAPGLYIAPYIIAPILTFIAFGFLNKRKASDFYHSVSSTRTCLYLSIFGAVATWIFAIMFLTSGISILIHLVFPNTFILNMAHILLNLFGIFVASVYSAAVISLAMSLTGTVLTNFAVSGLLLFLPDFLVSLVNDSIVSNLPVMAHKNVFSNYMPVGFNIFNLMFFGTNNGLYENIINSLVTLLYIGIVILLAIVAFKKRKSETAGYPTQNKTLQSVFRITVAFLVSVFGTITVFSCMFDKHYLSADTVFIVALVYVGAALAYFIYELITTKTFKTLPRAIPGLGIVVLLNIMLLGSMLGIYHINLNFAPNANKVDYIRLTNDAYYSSDLEGYYATKTANVKLTDDNIKEIICKALKDDIKAIKEDSYFNYTNDLGYYSEVQTVVISVNGIEHTREISLNEKETEDLVKALKSNKAFQKAYMTLPALNSKTTILKYAGLENKNDGERIYNLMRKNVAELDFETWYSIVHNYEGTALPDNFYITTMIGAKNYEISMPIYMELEEAFDEYIKIISTKKNEETILGIEEELNSNEYSDWIDYVWVEILGDSESRYYLEFMPGIEDDKEQLLDFISKLEPSSEITKDSKIAYVRLSYYYGHNYFEICGYFKCNEELEKLDESGEVFEVYG